MYNHGLIYRMKVRNGFIGLNHNHAFLSEQARNLLTERRGYRSEDAYGEGYRNFRDVITHEVKELGNIGGLKEMATRLNLRPSSSLPIVLQEIENRFGNDAKVIWLTTLEGVKQYTDHPDTMESVDVYRIPEGAFILNDLGSDGQLFVMTALDYRILESSRSPYSASKDEK